MLAPFLRRLEKLSESVFVIPCLRNEATKLQFARFIFSDPQLAAIARQPGDGRRFSESLAGPRISRQVRQSLPR
jgi:hypothetical protein